LDLLLIRNSNNKITHNFYQKPISSGRILNWLSNHPFMMKFNIGLSLANRVISLSDDCFHKENYDKIYKLLLKNNYPFTIIKRIINKIKNLKPSNKPQSEIVYKSLPYIPILTDQITKNIHHFNKNIMFGYKPVRKMRSLFSNTKSKIRNKRIGHIYKIECSDKNCNKTYIGQSGRSASDVKNNIIGERIKEHIRDYKKAKEEHDKIIHQRKIQISNLQNVPTRSRNKDLNELLIQHQNEDLERNYKTACIDHAIRNGHSFNFNEAKVVHNENNLTKRLCLESMYIHNENNNACNFRIDTEHLNHHTKQIINAYIFHQNNFAN